MTRSWTIALGLAAAMWCVGPVFRPGSEAALKSGPTSGILFAQAPAQGTPPPQIKGQTQVLGRPTRETDPIPVFDFDVYFLGRWAFELDVPDTDLGPGGTIKGTTTYRAVPNGTFDGGAFYEAETEATGPSGPLKIREVIGYEIAHKAMSRQVTDSRGFSYLQIGPIGADLGGYFNLHFAGTPFTYKGKTIKLDHSLRLLSPVQYQVRSTITVNGTTMPYGTAWWKKDLGVTK